MNWIQKFFKKEQKPTYLKVIDFINDNQDDNYCKEKLAKEFNIDVIKAEDLIWRWAVGDRVFIEEFFNKKVTVWEGTISSDGPEQQGPVTVLALRTPFDESEFKEGCQDAEIDFNTGKPMADNLNYPVHPYARGYVETYSSLQRNKK